MTVSEIERDIPAFFARGRTPAQAPPWQLRPQFAVRFGAEGAIKRVEGELRRARRARSRKLYTFWSAVLARIEPAQKTTPVSATSKSARVEGGDLSAPPEGVSPTKATLFRSVLLIDRAFGQGSGLGKPPIPTTPLSISSATGSKTCSGGSGLETRPHPIDRCAHTYFSAICIAAAVIFWL